MMSCEKVSNSLVSYLDGRASAEERLVVEAHLQSCAACRERAEEFRRLWDVMAEAPAVEPSFGFDARLRQRIAAEARPRMWSWLVPSPRLAAAVVVLVGLSVFVSVKPNRPITTGNPTANSEEQFRMIKDLGVLENYDVLSNFDALSDLPGAQPASQPQQDDPDTGNGAS
ncbi:MAG TPA: zf-HC2 domain-containing protein [Candidatus Acidoferrales bacterium]|nr:zf-HC2 domain-containing protein [Candidatus Acidoferrales bacterium]